VIPQLLLNPTSDATFVRTARDIVEETPVDIDLAQARLRDRYPDAVIRARDLSGEITVVWYVYRDGHWVR